MNDTEGHVDILVCMAGTGGTGFGTASYLRSRNPNLQVVLVQPHPDSRLTPEHPDAQIIDGVLPAYDVPESALSGTSYAGKTPSMICASGCSGVRRESGWGCTRTTCRFGLRLRR